MLSTSHTDNQLRNSSNYKTKNLLDDSFCDSKSGIFNTFDSSTCRANSVSTRKQKKNKSQSTYQNLLKARNQRSTSVCSKITPDLASKVVKDYLIPMFEKDLKHKHDEDRKLTFNLKRHRAKPRNLDNISGTVYNELKLSERLTIEIHQLTQKLTQAEKKMKDSEQAKIQIESEYIKLKDDYYNALTTSNTYMCSNSCHNKEYSSMQLNIEFLNNQVYKYKSLFEDSEKKLDLTTKELHDQNARNDKFRNTAIQLENNNYLLTMESELIGEKLKGLYLAFKDISDIQFKENSLENEITKIISHTEQLANFELGNFKILKEVIHERDHLFAEISASIISNEDSDVLKDKIIRASKEKIFGLNREIVVLREERDKAKADASETDRKFNELSEELKRTRRKMKIYRSNAQNLEFEEKFCNNCLKPFIEIQNYN